MKKSFMSIAFFFFMSCFFIFSPKMVTAASINIHQSASFFIDGPEVKVTRHDEDDILNGWRTVTKSQQKAINFFGAPKGFALGGMNYKLTNTMAEITSNIFYSLEINSEDGWPGPAEVYGMIASQHYIEGELNPHTAEYSNFLHAYDDPSFSFRNANANKTEEYVEPYNYSFDCSYLFYDVESFELTLTQLIVAGLGRWDTGDYNIWSLAYSSWKGDINLDYIYEPTTAVPIPSAVWLLGSGLVGIVGIRRKFKT